MATVLPKLRGRWRKSCLSAVALSGGATVYAARSGGGVAAHRVHLSLLIGRRSCRPVSAGQDAGEPASGARRGANGASAEIVSHLRLNQDSATGISSSRHTRFN